MKEEMKKAMEKYDRMIKVMEQARKEQSVISV